MGPATRHLAPALCRTYARTIHHALRVPPRHWDALGILRLESAGPALSATSQASSATTLPTCALFCVRRALSVALASVPRRYSRCASSTPARKTQAAGAPGTQRQGPARRVGAHPLKRVVARLTTPARCQADARPTRLVRTVLSWATGRARGGKDFARTGRVRPSRDSVTKQLRSATVVSNAAF